MGNMIFRLRPADTVTILFLFFLIVLTLIFYKEIPGASVLILTYSILGILLLIIMRFRKRSRFLGLLHDMVFPVSCVLVIFESLGSFVHYVNPEDIDPVLIKLDYLIFQGHPTVMLEKIMSPLLTDMLQIAYTTYYFLPIVLGVTFLMAHQREEFERSLFLILFCFYLSYIGYILMPALGPRFTINYLQSDLEGLFIAEPIQRLLNQLEGIKRDAFPSGHTAIPLTVLYLAYRFKRKLFWIFLPIVLALIFSTVYCRYHYVVDVIGGIVLTIITVFLGERYFDWWLKKTSFSDG